MKTKAIAALTGLLALGLLASPSYAGAGFDNTQENVIPGPLEDTPANPAANDDPAARVPTTRDEFKLKREGYEKGTSGKSEDNPMLKDGPME